MTSQPGPAASDPEHILTATRDLSRRVLHEQRGAWFPLLVFAIVTFAAIPFSPIHCTSTLGGRGCGTQSALAVWYWPVSFLLAYGAISCFYLLRSRQRGVGTRVLPYVVSGVVLLLLIPAFVAEHQRPSPLINFLHQTATPAVAIGLALLLLTWIERSWPLLAVTGAYLVVAVATLDVGRIHAWPWSLLVHLLLDGSVLLLGGVIIALTQRRRGRSAA